jgi:hypothetical protein
MRGGYLRKGGGYCKATSGPDGLYRRRGVGLIRAGLGPPSPLRGAAASRQRPNSLRELVEPSGAPHTALSARVTNGRDGQYRRRGGGIDSGGLRPALTPSGRRRFAAASQLAARVGRTRWGPSHSPLRQRHQRARWARWCLWRRGWDSNPRTGCPVAGFQDRCFQPLSHPSGFDSRQVARACRIG